MSLRGSPWIKALLILLWSFFCIGVTDVGMGILFRDRLALHEDERNLTYRYDPELGWFPIANSKKGFTGSRTIHIEHNSRGFRDVEHVVGAKPRIIFLGDSFVWGYDVEQSEDCFSGVLPGQRRRGQLTQYALRNLSQAVFHGRPRRFDATRCCRSKIRELLFFTT